MPPRQIAVLTALRCPKKSSHYSFARFFRPLRILRLASSATGGARLRIPIPREAALSSFLLASGGASLLENLVSTARRRGVPFTRVKGTKTRLGLCPKTPVAGCAGYGLIFDGSRKSIRTAHRIAPKVATGVSALSPHPLSRGGKGARMGGQVGTENDTLGVLGLAKTASRRP